MAHHYDIIFNKWIKKFACAENSEQYQKLSRECGLEIKMTKYNYGQKIELEDFLKIMPYMCSENRALVGNVVLTTFEEWFYPQENCGEVMNKLMSALLEENKLLLSHEKFVGSCLKLDPQSILGSKVFMDLATIAIVNGNIAFLKSATEKLGCALGDIKVRDYAFRNDNGSYVRLKHRARIDFPIKNLLIFNPKAELMDIFEGGIDSFPPYDFGYEVVDSFKHTADPKIFTNLGEALKRVDMYRKLIETREVIEVGLSGGNVSWAKAVKKM